MEKLLRNARLLFQRPQLLTGLVRSSRKVSSLVDRRTGLVSVGDGSYHPTWLRHNCQCPECIFTSGQKMVPGSELSPGVTLDSATISDGRLELSWTSGHHGYISLDMLSSSPLPVDSSRPGVARQLPVVSAARLPQDKESLWQWLHNVNEYGACLLTDLPTDEGAVRKLAEEAMYNIDSTIYGKEYVIQAKEDAGNIAFSSSELAFHMDMVYYECPPGLHLLHCLQFDECVVGGESGLLDMLPVMEELRDSWPQHFATLVRVPATFHKINYENNKAVDISRQVPHIQLDANEQIVGITWAPTIEGPLRAPPEDVGPYYEAYHCVIDIMSNSDLQLSHRLRPGEVLTFNNRRMVHSRSNFSLNGGVRSLKGVYVNIDHFKSAYKVLNKQLGRDMPVRRVFNNNST